MDQKILGVDSDFLNNKELSSQINNENFSEQTTYEPTPYYFIVNFINFLKPREDSVIYDLGSGYGRVVLFGASISKAKFVGIELVKERVDFARKRKEILGLKNAHFVQINATKADLFPGDIFFLFNPFLESTLNTVGANLKKVSQKKHIKIVCWGGLGIYNYFNSKNWLTQIHPPKGERIEKLSYFCSL